MVAIGTRVKDIRTDKCGQVIACSRAEDDVVLVEYDCGAGVPADWSKLDKLQILAAAPPKTVVKNERDELARSYVKIPPSKENIGNDDGDGQAEGYDDNNDFHCFVCETGGDLLCCEGVCLRSFHLECIKLKTVPKNSFKCLDCKKNIHTCMSCMKPGADGKEVIKCSRECGNFFHPACASSFNKKKNNTGALEFECPSHFCRKCGKGATKTKKLYRCIRCVEASHDACFDRTKVHELPEGERIVCERHDGTTVVPQTADSEVAEDQVVTTPPAKKARKGVRTDAPLGNDTPRSMSKPMFSPHSVKSPPRPLVGDAPHPVPVRNNGAQAEGTPKVEDSDVVHGARAHSESKGMPSDAESRSLQRAAMSEEEKRIDRVKRKMALLRKRDELLAQLQECSD